MLSQIIMRREQETTSSARRITNGLPWFRCDRVNNRGDQWARRKILPRAPFHVLGILLQQALVGVALHVGGEA